MTSSGTCFAPSPDTLTGNSVAAQGTALTVKLIEYPTSTGISAGANRRIVKLSNIYGNIINLYKNNKETTSANPESWERWSADLQHPLSDTWIAENPRSQRICRNDLEREVYEKYSKAICDALYSSDVSKFKENLLLAANDFSGGQVRCFRRAAVVVNSKAGPARLFVAAEKVEESICQLVRDTVSSSLPQTIIPVLAQARLLQIHPFQDCNGRVSRLLFHSVRLKIGMPYFPLGLVVAMSRGGFEIRLREFERSGVLSPLLDYFLTCAEAELDAYDT